MSDENNRYKNGKIFRYRNDDSLFYDCNIKKEDMIKNEKKYYNDNKKRD